MHGRVRVGRWVLWAAVAAGPIGLLVAAASSRQVVHAVPPSVHARCLWRCAQPRYGRSGGRVSPSTRSFPQRRAG
jgi:hypothetical protein